MRGGNREGAKLAAKADGLVWVGMGLATPTGLTAGTTDLDRGTI